MHFRVAIHLGRGCLQDAGAHALGQAQHVDGAMDAGLGGLDGVVLVVHWRRRAGEVVDLIHLYVKGERYVVSL